MQTFDVREHLSTEEFLAEYVRANRPVVIGGVEFDPAYWTPGNFKRDLGELPALIYDTLFDLQEVGTLGEYIDRHFGVEGEGLRRGVPYVRWYNRLKDVDHAWGDEAFKRLAPHWKAPPTLPLDGMLVPDAPSVDPVCDAFPYRGVLISAKGARTRLHRDPFWSDAVVAQFHGAKEAVMYHPSRAAELTERAKDGTSFGGFVDVRATALDKVDVEPDFHGILRPGQMLYVPHGWLHDVISIEDSISITWNFVHEQGGVEFIDYLMGGAEDDTEFEVLKYMYRRYGGEYTTPQDIVRHFDERFSEILDAYGEAA